MVWNVAVREAMKRIPQLICSRRWKITQLDVLEERRIEPGAELPTTDANATATEETATKENPEANR